MCAFIVTSLFLVGCATYKEQKSEDIIVAFKKSETPVQSIYIAGGYGTKKIGENDTTLALLGEHLSKARDNSILIFTGDNISKTNDNQDYDRTLLDQQLKLTDNFKGKTYFLPGDNEWKSLDIDQINTIEKYKKKKKDVSAEEDCPLRQIHIDDKLDMVLVNSKWFTSDWDEVKGIGKNCNGIVSPRRFLEELENYVNDAQGKNLIIVMHHPAFSNGRYSGEYTFGSQMLPLPVLGSLFTGIQGISGLASNYTSSPRYNAFRVLLSFVAQESDRITLISGHEQSLQYLVGKNGTHQIISGSLGETRATKRSTNTISTTGGSLEYEGKYTHAAKGFARLDYFADGSSRVQFITTENETEAFAVQNPIEERKSSPNIQVGPEQTVTKAILDEEDKSKVDKSSFYKLIWGKRYREYFAKSATAPVALLDTLYGGLKVAKEGGGHQSWTLRLEDKNGKQYAMRSLDKNALRILESNITGTAYNIENFEGTAVEDVIYDFFSTSHPYMLLPISPLAEAAKVNHANAKMFYVPKQNALGEYNDVYGDGLYFIEERPSDGWVDSEVYTRSTPETKGELVKFRSTSDMLEKLQEDESYSIDERSFIRARLFDMLIGDWDRHADQYRWGEYKVSKNDKIFVVIPRDRDNAFPKFDSRIISYLKWFTPLIRSWQTYTPTIKNLKWLNDKGNVLDNVLITKSGTDLWIEEAKAMQKNLSNEDIEKAFAVLPSEMKDATTEEIKETLKQRLQDLAMYAEKYGTYLNKRSVLHATHKDDIIDIQRLPDGKTKITMQRSLKDKPITVFYENTFDKNETKEIWIYGLNKTDHFIVKGEGDHEIFIRLIGGYGEDSFAISNKKALKVYDHKYEEIIFSEKTPRKQLTNQFKTNLFHWRNILESHNIFEPFLGFRSDDGLIIGGVDTYTVNGFNGNPFRQQHALSATYYSDFQSVSVGYKGVFANLFPSTNLELTALYNSNAFVSNFFGLGNETLNMEDELGTDFNRARIRQLELSAGLDLNIFKISVNFQNYRVEELSDRFFTPTNINPLAFESQSYVGTEASLNYNIEDSSGFPTRAFRVALKAGYKANTEISDLNFGYAQANLSLARKLVESGNLVFSAKLEGKANFGEDFLFYHAPSIGGNNGLRGFRDERFTGRRYFFQSSDLRLRIKSYPSAVVPITFGIFGGFDYGRVWLADDDSNVWHTSQGGGLWIGGLNSFGLNLGYFNSEDGNIVLVGFGFGF